MATGQRLTDPVLSGSPNHKYPHAPLSILNPKSQLAPSPPAPRKKIMSTLLASSVQPPSSEPGRGFALTTTGGGYCDATSPARLLPLRITPNSDVYVCLIPTQGKPQLKLSYASYLLVLRHTLMFTLFWYQHWAKHNWSYCVPLTSRYHDQLFYKCLFDTNTGQQQREQHILPLSSTI